MNLVQFLAAGVNGAANGSATFFLRGTASSAQAVMYNEFEGLTQPASNVVTLDANGSAEMYVNAYVDVEIKNSAGTTLRTVTVGNSAPVVEVRSTSFTGTDYDGSPANTAGEPITLKALLDKWITSAGSTNWQVLIGGIATNLQNAFAGISGLIINVKDPTYGAVGDGVTDDTTAILAAETAAAGKPVYFPPGTYKVTTLSLSSSNLNWFGAGVGASIISGTTSTNLIGLTNNTDTAWKNFSGLSFTSSGSYARLFNLEESQNVTFHRCSFDASQCSADAIESASTAGLAKVHITDCDFTLGAGTPSGIRNASTTGNRQLTVRGCNFKMPSGFTGRVIRGPEFNVSGCRFDASAVTSGTYRMIDAEDGTTAGKYVGNFTGNTFIDGGSSGFVFELTSTSAACDFAEDNNTFVGFVAPDASGEKGQTYEITDAESGIPGDIHLGSRKGRTIHISSDEDDFICSMCLEAEHVIIENTQVAGPVIYTVPALIPGLTGWIVVVPNTGGGAINYAFRGSDTEGPLINLDNGGNEAMTIGGGDSDVFVGHYHTNAMPNGTFRSFVNTEIVYDG